MTTEVNVLRVFTDADGKFRSPLGVVRRAQRLRRTDNG